MSTLNEVVEGREFRFSDAAAPGIAAVKHNWAPFLLMQVLAAALVVSYYRDPALREATASLQSLKANGGPWFDLASGSISGGILPQLAKIVTRKTKHVDVAFFIDTFWNAVIYALLAVLVDYFYRLQGVLFGSGIDVQTLVKKDLLDMGVFSPFLCMPLAVALFEWKKARFSTAGLMSALRLRFYRDKVIPILIPAWAYWVPMLFCVYAMPINLQFPFSQLASASWCLIFIFIAMS